MKLSIIIVNYNVKFFLEQCLYSTKNALNEFEKKVNKKNAEIIVVDNHSHDGSCEMVEQKFPDVHLIQNEKNVGFSVANNIAISIAKGEYILLLNPDTVVAEDTFLKAISFMESNKDAGSLGVKMIDGAGKFLPESKRSFPSPGVSFYKVFGFSKLFPRSRKFGKYHLTYLDKDKTNIIDVLPGAFMLLKKKAINKVGVLDENFFMYGEDIDLSYRISEAGYNNYYFPETTIIHYKGESTKKGSLNYVFLFYNAMIIFAQKHFSSGKADLYTFLIKSAVWFRAAISVFKRIFKSAFLPVLDSMIFFLGFFLIKPGWESYKFQAGGHYPKEYLIYAVPIYILVWIMSIFLAKGYRRPVESKYLFKGILGGTIMILVIYSLLNEAYRYSRVLLLLGAIWAIISSWLVRAFFYLIKFKEYTFKNNRAKKYLIISASDNVQNIKDLVISSQLFSSERSLFEYTEIFSDQNVNIEMLKSNRIDSIIFDYNIITAKDIIETMEKFSKLDIEYKIYSSDNNSIIGSNMINTKGDIQVSNINKISKPENKRIKRGSDIVFSILFLIFFFFIILIIDNKRDFFRNIINVLRGKYSWVGYVDDNSDANNKLPKIKEGILSPIIYSLQDKGEIYKINVQYAGNYNLTDDIYIIYKCFNKIGNKKL